MNNHKFLKIATNKKRRHINYIDLIAKISGLGITLVSNR